MVQDPHRVDVTLEPLDEYLVIQPTSDETPRPPRPRAARASSRRSATT
jgi:hypothetical protein